MLMEIFTDSLCSKLPPPRLDILWCKVLFLKLEYQLLLAQHFWRKLKTMNFWFFFSFLVSKMSHIFLNSSLVLLRSNSYSLIVRGSNLKNSIFEMPIITQILSINNFRIKSAKSINVHTIRKLVEYSLKNVPAKTMFTLTIFEILLSEGR